MTKEKSQQNNYLSAISELLNQLFYFDSAQNRKIEQQAEKLSPDKQKGVLEILQQAKKNQDQLLIKLIEEDKNFAQLFTASINKNTRKIIAGYEETTSSEADKLLTDL